MSLPHGAPRLDDGEQAVRVGSQDPALERAPVEQVAQGGALVAVMGDRQRVTECEDAVHHLPRAVHRRVESPGIQRVGESGVDPGTQRGTIFVGLTRGGSR